MDKAPRLALPLRQARKIILLGLALGLVVSGARIFFDLQRERRYIQTTADQIAQMFSPVAIQAAHRADRQIAHWVVDGLFQYQAVSHARLSDSEGQVLAQGSRHPGDHYLDWLVRLCFGPDPQRQVPLYPNLNQAPVGSLNVVLDNRVLAANFLERAQLTVVSGVFFALGLAVLLTWLLYTYVTLPLIRMVKGVSRLDPEDDELDLLEMKSNPLQEVSSLAQSINHLLEDLNSSVAKMKSAQFQVKERERRLSHIIDNVPDGICTVDEQGQVDACNQAAARMFGRAPADLTGQPFLGLLGGANSGPINHRIDRYLYSGDPRLLNQLPQEALALSPHGGALPVQVRFTEVRLYHKRLLICVLSDLSERLRNEQALQESEARYRSLYDNITDFIITHDLEGRFISVNRSAANSLGYEPEELAGRPISEVMLPEYRQQFYDQYLKDIIGDGQCSGVSIYLAKDGGRHYIEYRNQLVSEEGRQPYVSGLGREITQRLMAQYELKKMQKQLLQSQKMEAVGTLASGIAHDFNNILQAISGSVQILLKKQDWGQGETRYLSEIDRATQRASDLVRGLLTFGRKVTPRLGPVDLNHEVREVIKVLERTIPKMIKLEVKLAPDLRLVNADSSQMDQVLLNLGANARDAIPEGGSITITTQNVVVDGKGSLHPMHISPGQYVHLRFADTGRGMDQKTARHIFEPFFTTKNPGQGTGLGLSTVYGIIKGHKGHIACHSRPGRGTVFDIYLPVLPEGFMRIVGEPEAAQELRGGRETLLLVDDEESIRTIGREVLGGLGYTVLLAASGEAALEIYRQQGAGIDLVILDLGMPGMGGQRCLTELTRLDPQIHVLIASGYTLDDKLQKMMAKDAIGFLPKPYRLAALVQKVRDMLDQADRQDSSD